MVYFSDGEALVVLENAGEQDSPDHFVLIVAEIPDSLFENARRVVQTLRF